MSNEVLPISKVTGLKSEKKSIEKEANCCPFISGNTNQGLDAASMKKGSLHIITVSRVTYTSNLIDI